MSTHTIKIVQSVMPDGRLGIMSRVVYDMPVLDILSVILSLVSLAVAIYFGWHVKKIHHHVVGRRRGVDNGADTQVNPIGT